MKSTLIIKSGGFVITANPLKGVRIYKNKKILKEYSDCWASVLFSMFNIILTNYGYNVFTERWTTISLPEDKEVRRLVALIASLIHNKITELRDPMFRRCLNPDNPSSKTPS
jgi:hypothetical protein